MMSDDISATLPYPSKFIDVYGSKMHYVEAGVGDPILFLHGIPTSCYLWRNVIPHLETLGRCIAPDLIGFGRSDKPNIDYSVVDHIKYIDQFIERLGLDKITIIMHGFGSIIGFDYFARNPKKCKSLAFYEAYLRPMDSADLSLPLQEQLLSLQGTLDNYASGGSGVNYLEKILPLPLDRRLSAEELNHYREPFIESGTDKPLLAYIKELQSGTGKSVVDKIISNYSKVLTESSIPKLLLYSIPGFITTISTVIWAKDHLPHLEIVDIGEELHLAQESNPQLMGETISVWLQGVEQTF